MTALAGRKRGCQLRGNIRIGLRAECGTWAGLPHSLWQPCTACSHDCSHSLQRIKGARLRIVKVVQPAPQQWIWHPAGRIHAVRRCECQPRGDQRRAAHMLLARPAAQAAHVREPAGVLEQRGSEQAGERRSDGAGGSSWQRRRAAAAGSDGGQRRRQRQQAAAGLP